MPSASAALKPFFAASVGDYFIASTGYTGEDGYEITLPAEQAESLWNRSPRPGVRPCGLGARDTLRLEAGMNLYGQDMDETVSPLDAGLAWTVDLVSPRDFVGKAALLARPQQYQFLGLCCSTAACCAPTRRSRRAHGDGEITSGSFSPTMQQSIALARLPLAVAIGDTVQVGVRDKLLSARSSSPASSGTAAFSFDPAWPAHSPDFNPIIRRTDEHPRRPQVHQQSRMDPQRSRRHDQRRHHRACAGTARRPRLHRAARGRQRTRCRTGSRRR
jgi:glycine cleavage system aminomethyltransferase T